MRKTIILIVAALFAMNGTAQNKYWDTSRPDHWLTVGLRAGANSSKQYAMDEQSDRNARLGFHAGVAADINLVRSFAISLSALYVQKGWKVDYSDNRGSIEKKDNTAYLEIPLQAGYRVRLSDQAQFHLNLGPYFAFGLSGKQKVTNTFPNGTNYDIDSFDENEGCKKFDYGVAVGAAFTLQHLYAGLSYERSLTNVSNVSDRRYQNGSIALTLGYNF